jgi:hypothetical protein
MRACAEPGRQAALPPRPSPPAAAPSNIIEAPWLVNSGHGASLRRPLQTDFCSAGWDHGAAGEQATRIRELEQKLYLAPAAAAALEPEAEAGTGAPYLAINVGAVGEPAAAYGQLSAIGAASPRGIMIGSSHRPDGHRHHPQQRQQQQQEGAQQEGNDASSAHWPSIIIQQPPPPPLRAVQFGAVHCSDGSVSMIGLAINDADVVNSWSSGSDDADDEAQVAGRLETDGYATGAASVASI